jgi:putative hemolysin
MIGQCIFLVFLLVLSAFFSASETALFSISRTKARHLAKSNAKTDKMIFQMKQNPHRLLSTVLIGNTLVNIGGSALATSLAIQLFPNNAVGYATGCMTFLILVFGEVFPKSLATRNNVLISRIVIYPIHWLSILFLPFIFFLNFIPRLTGKIQKRTAITEEELITFVEAVEEEGEIKEEEVELIHNIFELDDTSASEIMTPRADMFVIQANEPLKIEEVLKSGYTRIPVIEDDMDDIVGIVNIKDMFLQFATSAGKIDLKKIMAPPYFIPENIKLDTLLQSFKKRKNHMAILIDEHGGVSGLVTLEDALEELVGDIVDESDREEPLIQNIDENQWIVLGKAEIGEVNEALSMDIPESEYYDTFSGYIMDVSGRIPNEKDEFTVGKFHVAVLEKEGNRINKYMVRKIQDEMTEPPEIPAEPGDK